MSGICSFKNKKGDCSFNWIDVLMQENYFAERNDRKKFTSKTDHYYYINNIKLFLFSFSASLNSDCMQKIYIAKSSDLL